MSLTPLIQTYSIENALKPFANKVTELLLLTENPRQGKFSDLVSSSDSLRTAVKNLSDFGLEVCKLPEADEILRKEMVVACVQSSQSAAALTEEIKRISASTTLTNCKGTYESIEGIMEGTMKILVAWDDSEVRKIIHVAQITHDRLRLVQAARSMRGLVVCYTGFTESIVIMLQLALERHKDMSNRKKREKLQKSLKTIQNNLQLLNNATRKCIRNPSLTEDKDIVIDVIASAIRDLIAAVTKVNDAEDTLEDILSDDKISSSPLTNVTPNSDTESSTVDGSETLATNIVKAISSAQKFRKSTEISVASLDQPVFRMSPQLDIYIKEIMKNSKAVADVSKPHYKQAIMKLREEIQEFRHRLGVYLEVLQANQTSQQARNQFNLTADLLCSKLLELDKLVAQSVADQFAEIFVDTSAPIKELIQAVVSIPSPGESQSPVESGDSDIEYRDHTDSDELDRNIKVFRRRSLKLSEVAVQAAQGTLDRKRAKQVKVIAGELTDLTSPVVSTALKVKQDNVDHDELHDIGRRWNHKAQELKVAVDEIIRPVDFAAATEATVADEMIKCRQAINDRNWAELLSISQSIAAKGKRVVEVGRITVESIRDTLQKTMITEALNNLEENITNMVEQAEGFSSHSGDEQAISQFASSLQKILSDIQHIQEILPDTSISSTVHPHMKRIPQENTSTPISVPPTFTLDRNEWTPKSGLDDGSPILRQFNNDDPSPYTRPTSTKVPVMVGVSVGGGERNNTQSMGTQVLMNDSQSVGVQVTNNGGVSIGTQMSPSINDGGVSMNHEEPQTPPSTLSGIYRALSPSDEWIYQTSTKDTSPSSFAPTNLSPYPSGQEDHDLSDLTPPRTGQKGIDNIVQYPSSIEGLNVTPSLHRMLNNQSDFSLTSDLTSDHDKHDIQSPTPRYMATFTQPLQNVLTAANEGNTAELNTHASILNARTNRLVKLADTASNTVSDQNLASVLQKKSAHLAHLTPQIIRHAKLKAQETKREEDETPNQTEDPLDFLVHQWTGHVRTLLDASQRANMPWSNMARRLVTSAREKSNHLEKEIKHINGHSNRMVKVATTSIEAATTEDNIGSTNNLQHQTDPVVQDQIEHIRTQIQDMETITPDFITTAEQVAANTDEEGYDDDNSQVTVAIEQLNLISHEWATKANALMKGVDDITIGMSGPADSLLISASSGDPALLDEQCRSVMELSKSMLKISQDSILGCTDQQMIDTVLRTANALIEISQELVDCAKGLAARVSSGNRVGLENRQLLVEIAEILRRDWSAKMHLLTAHIDDLTANVAGPLDRLVSVALQASRTEGMAKDYLLNQFEDKENFTKMQLEVVSTELKEHVSTISETNQTLHKCSMAVAFLTKVTPRAIEAARVLSRDPSSAKLDHFSHLRRQWASKAQNFRANLDTLSTDIDISNLEMAFHELLQGHKSFRRRSVTPTSLEGMKYRQRKGEIPQGEEHDFTMDTIVRSYSSEDLGPPLGPAPPPPEMDNEQENLPYSKPMGYSEPASPQQDYSPTATTPVKVPLRPPRSFTPDLSSKRHLSMSTLPSWEEIEDNSMNTSSASIAVAAQTLKETADKFLEEGNPFIALAKKMSHQMYQMSLFARGKGELQTKSDMIHTAKAIAANAEQIARYANAVSEQCSDDRMRTSLESCSDMIPTISTQLKIIASVKSCNPNDLSADVMLVKNAQNLMQAVIQTIQAAEAAYMKGLKPLNNSGEFDSAALAIDWKRKLYIQRTMESISAPMGAKGLRKLNKKNRYSTSSVAELLSPTRYK